MRLKIHVCRLICLALAVSSNICVLLLPIVIHAENRTIVSEATYLMGDGETPNLAEARALRKAKQVALEQAGTYVQSYTRVQNFDLTVDEIQTIAGGVLKVEVLKKTRKLIDEGLLFYIQIRATVTTDQMEDLARRIKGTDLAEEHRKLQEDYARLGREVEALKKKIAANRSDSEREPLLEQIREQEKAFSAVQNHEAVLYERLVSGKDLSVKLEQQAEDQRASFEKRKVLLDKLYEDIVKRGHIVAIGEPDIHLDPNNPKIAEVTVPVQVKANQEIQGEVAKTGLAVDVDRFLTTRLMFVMEVVLRDGTIYACHTGDLNKLTPWNKKTSDTGKITLDVPMNRVRDITAVRGKFVQGDFNSKAAYGSDQYGAFVYGQASSKRSCRYQQVKE